LQRHAAAVKLKKQVDESEREKAVWSKEVAWLPRCQSEREKAQIQMGKGMGGFALTLMERHKAK